MRNRLGPALDYHSMAGKRSVEQQLAALDELRHQAPEACIEPLRKVLAYRNNYVVAKAADLVREFRLSGLMPELLAAFDRFFANPIKTDPQCWAKNALSRALAALECQDSRVFLRGLRHIQLEPVWGGVSDTAGTLRGTCALALVGCRDLLENELLAYLIELLTDKPVERLAILYAPPGDPEPFREEVIAAMTGGVDPATVPIQIIGPSVGPHLGPGCIGGVVLYRH